MKDILSDLIKKIQLYSGSYENLNLIEGMKEEAVKKLEEEWDVEFPNDLRLTLKYLGKTVIDPKYKDLILTVPHYGEMGLTSESQLRTVYQLLMASDYQQKTKHDCKGISEEFLWNPKWIPVAAYGNHSIHDRLSLYDLIVLDERSALYQKVVHWSYRSGVVRIVADSFEDYISHFYNDLDCMSWDGTYGFSF